MPSTLTPITAQSSVDASLRDNGTDPVAAGAAAEGEDPPPPQARPRARAERPARVIPADNRDLRDRSMQGSFGKRVRLRPEGGGC